METKAVYPSIQSSLFGGKVRWAFFGRRYGSCHTKDPIDPDAIKRIEEARLVIGKSKGVVLPSIEHGTNIVEIKHFKNGSQFQVLDNCVTKTTVPADGLVTRNPEIALAIANADCPVGVIYHPETEWLCLLHLGIKCLLTEPNIIDRALELAPARPHDLHFRFGLGIRKCCFGYRKGEKILTKVKEIAPLALDGIVEKGPRKGGQAVSLSKIILKLTRRRFASETSLIEGSTCTACSQDVPGHSHVYDVGTPDDGCRNVVVVQLAP